MKMFDLSLFYSPYLNFFKVYIKICCLKYIICISKEDNKKNIKKAGNKKLETIEIYESIKATEDRTI